MLVDAASGSSRRQRPRALAARRRRAAGARPTSLAEAGRSATRRTDARAVRSAISSRVALVPMSIAAPSRSVGRLVAAGAGRHPPPDRVVATGQVPGVVGVEALDARRVPAHAAASGRGPTCAGAGARRRARPRSERGRRPAPRRGTSASARRTPPAASSRLTAAVRGGADQPVAGRHRRAVVEQGRVADHDRAPSRVADHHLERALGISAEQRGDGGAIAAGGRAVVGRRPAGQRRGGAAGATPRAARRPPMRGSSRLMQRRAGRSRGGRPARPARTRSATVLRSCAASPPGSPLPGGALAGSPWPSRRRSVRLAAGRPRRGPVAAGGRCWRRRRARSSPGWSTNWLRSFSLTSANAPRPNCATLPVMVRSVVTVTFVVSASTGSSWAVISADALPLPPVSRPSALSTARCFSASLLDEARLALELGRDRPDLHLHQAAVGVALDLRELRARAGTGRCAPRRSASSTPCRWARSR